METKFELGQCVLKTKAANVERKLTPSGMA